MKVSVRKISEATGFSPATVSNALNYKKGVNAETAELVRSKAREMGYFETVGRISKIKFAMYKKDGTILEDTPFFPLMLKGIEEESRALGFELTVVNLERRNPDFDEQVRLLQNDQSSGVILLATEFVDEDISIIRNMNVPFVVIDYWVEDMSFDAVAATNQDSARMAVSYLISKGHRRIGYLAGNFRIKPFRARAAGVKIALEKCGIQFDKKRDEVILTANMDGAYRDMKEYLKTNPPLPTAFFADNDVIALGAMKAMAEKGIRVPEDVSIVGFDDVSFSSISSPPLTTMRVPKLELGRAAVRRLNDVIRDQDDIKIKVQMCTQFVERESVRDLNAG